MKELPLNKIIVGDAKEKLQELPENSIDTAMTSPPYWSLRDYGEKGQLGLEETPEKYVENLIDVFNELKRVLKPTGTFYLNIDDTYSGGGGVQGIPEDHESISTQRREKYSSYKPSRNMDLPDKSMSMIPERVMMAMVDNGWILRNKIVWRKKGGGMPESVTDRFSTTWEYVYMFSLDQDYYFDLDAIREPYKENSLARDNRGVGDNKWVDGASGQTEHSMMQPKEEQDSLHPKGKNPGDMWRISTAQMSEAHFAVYPPELVKKPVKAGCPKKVCAECGTPYERNDSDNFEKQCRCENRETRKGVILDPFSGAGTTALVARQHNRNYIGIELNEEYAEMARKRIKNEVGGQPLDQFIEKEVEK